MEGFMDRFASAVIHHKKLVLFIFLAAAAICACLVPFVGVNYNMADYLPAEAQSTKALDIMTEEFGSSMPNTNVMVTNVTLQQALEYKKLLQQIDGVSEVLWLDDSVDLKQPLELADPKTVEGFYQDGNALFTVTVEEGKEDQAIDAIWDVVGEQGAVSGETPDLVATRQAANTEVTGAVSILLPIITIILLLSTSSWIEPLLFFAAIGVSILINMGTNLIFGEVSFMTNSVSPILQLAVSLDYAIFFLHSFGDNRKRYQDTATAMRYSIRQSIPTVAASALTTLFGFLALTFMDFRIGADLGLSLAKGIIFSFISCMVFLPALTLLTYRMIDRTHHRPLMPTFQSIGRFLSKFALPAVILVAFVAVPCFLGQAQTGFTYGNGDVAPNSLSGQSKEAVRETFGQSTIIALLVPRGEPSKELSLSEDLEQLDHVTSVVSYAKTVGTAFPPEFLGEEITSQFYSDQYARIVVYTDTSEEGDVAFQTVEDVMAAARAYYGDSVYSVGQSANLYDMKEVVSQDNVSVTLIAILAIFVVLVITFRSASLPLILLLTIEAGIWINLSIPYFSGMTINFIGYLVINTVQLGATVDYAILLTHNYMAKRRELPKEQAVHEALGGSFKSILVSAATLATAGFTLAATSSNPGVSDLGFLLGRGTLLSFAMVVCFLPAMLKFCDSFISKTTYRSGFLSTRTVSRSGRTKHQGGNL
jgi:predicted RND superfamily exporter protein